MLISDQLLLYLLLRKMAAKQRQTFLCLLLFK